MFYVTFCYIKKNTLEEFEFRPLTEFNSRLVYSFGIFSETQVDVK